MLAPVSRRTAECSAFCRYLVGREPSSYVAMCYARAWDSSGSEPGGEFPLIDRSLLALARRGNLPARVADAYARIFRPFGPLRKRLILLLAILENSPPTSRPLNSARTGSVAATGLAIGVTLLASAGSLLAGLLLFGPVHLLSKLQGGGRGGIR